MTKRNDKRELICLAAMRQARADFFNALEAHASKQVGLASPSDLDREQRKLLRSEAVAQIAEFFYVLKFGGIAVPDGVRSFLERHNADMKDLMATCKNGYAIGGLSKQRIQKSIFSENQINYVLHECASGQLRFDQQSLQRIFTQTMSFETCRTLLVLLSELGFLQRWEFNQVIIASRGILEDCYRTHLESIVDAIAEA